MNFDNIDRNKEKLIANIINFLCLVGLILTIVAIYYGFKLGIFTSEEKLHKFIQGFGIMGPLVFIIIQIIQTVVPIIPAALTCPAAAVIFGHLDGFILNLIGIMIGSVINFFLARKYGRKIVRILVGEKKFNKSIAWMETDDKFTKIFTFGMLFPVSPADLLCLLAGLSKMSFKRFFITLCIGKPITLFLYTSGLLELIKIIANYFGVTL